MQSVVGVKFNIFSMISALVYSRVVFPYSKSKTFGEVISKLFEQYDFSLSQIYSGLEYIGSEYEKNIEIYNHQIDQFYAFDTSHSEFHSLLIDGNKMQNFAFEISTKPQCVMFARLNFMCFAGRP